MGPYFLNVKLSSYILERYFAAPPAFQKDLRFYKVLNFQSGYLPNVFTDFQSIIGHHQFHIRSLNTIFREEQS